MRHLLRLQRSSLIYCALGLAAIIGWSSFAYLTWSARELSRQVSILTTERDEAIADRNAVRAKHEQLQRSAGELKQVEAKLNMGNAELNRTVRAWAAAEQNSRSSTSEWKRQKRAFLKPAAFAKQRLPSDPLANRSKTAGSHCHLHESLSPNSQELRSLSRCVAHVARFEGASYD